MASAVNRTQKFGLESPLQCRSGETDRCQILNTRALAHSTPLIWSGVSELALDCLWHVLQSSRRHLVDHDHAKTISSEDTKNHTLFRDHCRTENFFEEL